MRGLHSSARGYRSLAIKNCRVMQVRACSHARPGKCLDTMLRLSRRSFLAASAAVVAAPALLRAQQAAEVDVAIVGAGAAGIAAGRRVAAANRRIVLLEAANRIGGRCITDSTIFDAPLDLGAHWIHRPDGNLPGGLPSIPGL